MPETLNIVSETFAKNIVGGPNKVVLNTIKGLKKTGYPFVINKNIKDYKYNWIHDSAKALIEVGLQKKPAIIGPNLVVLPKDFPSHRPKLQNCLYLLPCQWSVDVWKLVGYNECPLYPWASGIDSDEFEIKRDMALTADNIMVYYKRRDPYLLDKAIEIVKEMGFNPIVVKYGSYGEAEYKIILSQCKFGIWIGISESQGIGLMEALASNLPLIVCDVHSLFESNDKKEYRFPESLRTFKPTSAPYFNKECGIVIDELTKLPISIREMQKDFLNYNPRKFIVENFSLEKKAKDLLVFFDILKQKEPEYFNAPVAIPTGDNFNVSTFTQLIYLNFIFLRKIKTVWRLTKNKFS